jgi:hypothetical protein
VAVFLIFGLRTKAEQLGMLAAACRVCGQVGSLLLVRETTKLSLFFIPLVPVRRRYVAHCTNPLCGNRTTVSRGEARRLLAGAAAR